MFGKNKEPIGEGIAPFLMMLALAKVLKVKPQDLADAMNDEEELLDFATEFTLKLLRGKTKGGDK